MNTRISSMNQRRVVNGGSSKIHSRDYLYVFPHCRLICLPHPIINDRHHHTTRRPVWGRKPRTSVFSEKLHDESVRLVSPRLKSGKPMRYVVSNFCSCQPENWYTACTPNPEPDGQHQNSQRPNMIDVHRVHPVPHLTRPVLSAYLDTNPANRRNQGRPPGYMTWLKSEGRFIAEQVSGGEKRLLQQQLLRVFQYLQSHPPHRRGTVIFAGPTSWELLEFQVDLSDELHWGRPSFKQLLWILDEHRPMGAVLVKRDAARLFRISFGEIVEEKQNALSIDTSTWRKKDLVGPSHPYAGKTKGSQRDAFQDRVEAQYNRFLRELANQIRQWADQEKLSPVFLAGPNRIIETIWASFPAAFRERAALLKGNLWDLSLLDLQSHLNLAIKRWERAHELAMVNHLLASERSARVAVGIENTLAHLQKGRVRQLVIARGLRGEVYQCERCSHADRSLRRDCLNCGGPRRVVALRAALPELARHNAAPVEIVAGEAASKLIKKGGVAAWLRYTPVSRSSYKRGA
jgi:Bacterial archaeo-eukaryotic release factor family 10